MAATQPPARPCDDEGGSARRHSQALVALARELWTAHGTLESALARICEVAAATLDVDRVNIWRLHRDHGVLRCIHAYDRRTGAHNPPGFDEAFDVDSPYGRRLDDVRVIDAADVHADDVLRASKPSLGGYLERYGVTSLLDAPVRGDGALMGVVCHEQVGEPRAWTAADQAFAASIGDYVAMLSETYRRRAAEGRLRYLQLHDPQTQLPNRDHLLSVVHGALRPAGLGDAVVAIHLHVDAVHGDPAPLMVAVAMALRESVAEEATVARVRNDALAVVPHRSLSGQAALELAGRCVELGEQAVDGDRVRMSAGIAFSHDLSTPSAEALLRNAELASQRVRSFGGIDRCEVFDAGRHRDLLERMRTERALREAHEQGHLHVHYQPVVGLADGRAVGAEALLRWRDGPHWRPACEFIDVAESSGLIVPLGRWVLEQACTSAAAWRTASGADPLLSVNVSARQVTHPAFVDDVAAALDVSGLAPGRLWLELTETALLPDAAAAIDTLARLRALGVRVALDDFGTGWSSFARIKRLPIDGLKIDRGFVADLPHDPLDLAIVYAIVSVARQAGLGVVAEGVEVAAQAEALAGCGVAMVQGWHYGCAMPEAEVRSLFQRDG